MKRIQPLTLALFAMAASIWSQDAQAAHVDIVPYFVGRSDWIAFSEPPTALKTGSFDLNKWGSGAMIDTDDRVFTGTAVNYATGPG